MATKKKTGKKNKGSTKENYDLSLTCTNCYHGFVSVEIPLKNEFTTQANNISCPTCGVKGKYVQRFKLNPYLTN